MGKSSSKLPPINERDLRIVLSYNMEEKHIKKMWNKFIEADTHCNGVWTVQELYRVIDEPRLSMRAPIIEALFFMADAKSEGCIDFQDFLIALSSFCALSKEEVLHLFFIMVDKDRNGQVEKEELLDFFSYVPISSENGEREPIFPVNNKNALDQFRRGKWESLEFDGFAQLCERFPYISYPSFHVQELYRHELLGRSFWSRLDEDRSKNKGSSRTRRVNLPGSKEKVQVKMPGRCTMQELLEYSRRKTALHAGRRVARHSDDDEGDLQVSSSITKERDEQISRCPLLNMIRNSRCMYYVPYNPKDAGAGKQYKSGQGPRQTLRPEMELPELELELDPEPGGGLRGSITQGPPPWMQQVEAEEEESGSSSGSYESSEEDEALALQDGGRVPSHMLHRISQSSAQPLPSGNGSKRHSKMSALPPAPQLPALPN